MRTNPWTLFVVAICVNVYPEPQAARIAPSRDLTQLVPTRDFEITTDPLLDRTLQVHVTHDPHGALVLNLYGGAIDQAGLDELGRAILDELHRLVTTPAERALG